MRNKFSSDRAFDLAEVYSVEELNAGLKKYEAKYMCWMLASVICIVFAGTLLCTLLMTDAIKPLWLDLVFWVVFTLACVYGFRALARKVDGIFQSQEDVILAIYVKQAGITRDANEIAEKYQEP